MTHADDIAARLVRLQRHKAIIVIASALAAAAAGLSHLYFHYRLPMSWFRRSFPMPGMGGLLYACIVMWPFAVFASRAVRSISSKYKDLALSLATVAGGLVALCANDLPANSGGEGFADFALAECGILMAMIAVPHFFMDGLEDSVE